MPVRQHLLALLAAGQLLLMERDRRAGLRRQAPSAAAPSAGSCRAASSRTAAGASRCGCASAAARPRPATSVRPGPIRYDQTVSRSAATVLRAPISHPESFVSPVVCPRCLLHVTNDNGYRRRFHRRSREHSAIHLGRDDVSVQRRARGSSTPARTASSSPTAATCAAASPNGSGCASRTTSAPGWPTRLDRVDPARSPIATSPTPCTCAERSPASTSPPRTTNRCSPDDIDTVNLFAATPDIPPALAGGQRQAGAGRIRVGQVLSTLARDAIDVFSALDEGRVRACDADDLPHGLPRRIPHEQSPLVLDGALRQPRQGARPPRARRHAPP